MLGRSAASLLMGRNPIRRLAGNIHYPGRRTIWVLGSLDGAGLRTMKQAGVTKHSQSWSLWLETQAAEDTRSSCALQLMVTEAHRGRTWRDVQNCCGDGVHAHSVHHLPFIFIFIFIFIFLFYFI
jgi:hypothetical protein